MVDLTGLAHCTSWQIILLYHFYILNYKKDYACLDLVNTLFGVTIFKVTSMSPVLFSFVAYN